MSRRVKVRENMKKSKGIYGIRRRAVCLAGAMILALAACGGNGGADLNLVASREENHKVVNLFSPMEKTDPDAENTARSAADKTIVMAEEKLGLTVGPGSQFRFP